MYWRATWKRRPAIPTPRSTTWAVAGTVTPGGAYKRHVIQRGRAPRKPELAKGILKNLQRGATLLVVLVMLVVITLLGIARHSHEHLEPHHRGQHAGAQIHRKLRPARDRAVMNKHLRRSYADCELTTERDRFGTDPLVIYGVPPGSASR
jgi:hypothetical protein